MKLIALCLGLVMSVFSGNQQTAAPVGDGFVFGGLRLLPGYSCSPPRAELPYWTISKKDGITIRYTGGNVANVVHDWIQDAMKDGGVTWVREQVLGERTVKIAGTKDGRVLIHIAPFNFEAKVASVEEVTDVLMMVLTYGAAEGR